MTHRLSCVQASAPPEAVIVAKAAMIMAYESRHRGITYSKIDVAASGGSPGTFPREQGIHAMADASWGTRNIYACLVMMNYGLIVAETKKMGPVDSSAEGEGIATSKCAEILENVREIARGMGILSDEPTVIRCDNESSVRVSNDPKSAGRLRHAQRRYATLQARVARGDVIVVHVPDASNAADFLTKWIPRAKLNESIAYASNAAAKKQGIANDVPAPESVLEASALEIEWVYMELRSGTRKYSPTIAKEVAWGDPPSPAAEDPPPVGEAPPGWPPVQFGISELFVDDEMEVEEEEDDENDENANNVNIYASVNAPSALEVSMAELDPYYSDTESDLISEAGVYSEAPWITGDGPGMHAFPYFDDFVIYYRIYETSDAMWHAWNAAQDFDVDEFEEAVPDLLPGDEEDGD